MRRAISLVLAATLVLTPIKMVVAQARQQASQVAVTDSTDQTPTRIGVPVVEPGSSAALLFTVGMADDTLSRDVLAFSPPYRGVSTAGKVVLIVVGVLVVAAAIFVIADSVGRAIVHNSRISPT